MKKGRVVPYVNIGIVCIASTLAIQHDFSLIDIVHDDLSYQHKAL